MPTSVFYSSNKVFLDILDIYIRNRPATEPVTVKIVDSGLYFIFPFSFLFYFSFLFIFIFYFQNNSGQGLSVTLSHHGRSRRNQNKVTSYNMDTTCWPHVLLMVIQGRVHSSQHRPWRLVYKVDHSVLRTLSSSLVLLNTRVVSSLNPLSFDS